MTEPAEVLAWIQESHSKMYKMKKTRNTKLHPLIGELADLLHNEEEENKEINVHVAEVIRLNIQIELKNERKRILRKQIQRVLKQISDELGEKPVKKAREIMLDD